MRIPRCVATKVEVGCSLADLSSSCARVLLSRSVLCAALALHAGVREAERKEGTDCLAFGLALFLSLSFLLLEPWYVSLARYIYNSSTRLEKSYK